MSHYLAYKSTAVGTNLTVKEQSYYSGLTSLLTNEGVIGTGFLVSQTSPASSQVKVNDGFIAIYHAVSKFYYIAWSQNALSYELVSIDSNADPSNSRRDLICYAIDLTAVETSGGGGSIVVVKGTPSGSPADPDLTTIDNGTTKFAVPLARVTIPPSTINITNSMITQTGTTNNSTPESIYRLAYIENSLIESGRFADLTGGIFTGKIQFNTTSSSGLRFNNLTTTQRDLLTPSNGDVIFNTTDDQAQVYSSAGWFGTGITQTQKNVLTNQISSNYF